MMSSQSNQPDVSVLMASYNAAEFIESAIASALSSRSVDVEVVIQDGGSTDATLEIVERLDDPRVHIVSEPDDGQSDALNRALARARGRWIGWLNADDVYRPEGLERLTAHLDQGLDWIYGDYETVDGSGEVLKRYHSSRRLTRRNLLRHGVFVNCSAGLYRRELLTAVGGLDEDLHYCMDYDLLFRLVEADARTRYVPGVVQALRTHDDAKTSQAPERITEEGWQVAKHYSEGDSAGRALALVGHAVFKAYLLTLPIWQSTTWRRLRFEKQL